MGYDVTFHPFKKTEYTYYVEKVVENPTDYLYQLENIHPEA